MAAAEGAKRNTAAIALALTALVLMLAGLFWLRSNRDSQWWWVAGPAIAVYLVFETVQKLRARVEPFDSSLHSHMRYLFLGLALAIGGIGSQVRVETRWQDRLIGAAIAVVGIVMVVAGTRDLRRWLATNEDNIDPASTSYSDDYESTPPAAVSVALGIELRLTTAEQGGRRGPIGGVGDDYVARRYRPDWRLPGMTAPDMSGAPVLCFQNYPVVAGEPTRAVIVPLAASMIPRWKVVHVGDRLLMCEGPNICGEAVVQWSRATLDPMPSGDLTEFRAWCDEGVEPPASAASP